MPQEQKQFQQPQQVQPQQFQQAGGQPAPNPVQVDDNITIEKNAQANEKEENDLPSLLKRIESAVQSGGNPQPLIDEWILEKETVSSTLYYTFYKIDAKLKLKKMY